MTADRHLFYPPSKFDMDRMREEQEDRCAICGRETRALVPDHEHESGLVRGLLCRTCNAGLGSLGDSLVALQNAVRYLQDFEDRVLSPRPTQGQCSAMLDRRPHRQCSRRATTTRGLCLLHEYPELHLTAVRY